jgi:hypothetical protein
VQCNPGPTTADTSRWYSTLIGTAPSFALGSYDHTWLSPPAARFGHRFEESPLSIQFSLLENEAMGMVARPGGYWGDLE